MSRRFIEVRNGGEVEGIIAVRDDGYTEVHLEWLQILLEQSGRDWTITGGGWA